MLFFPSKVESFELVITKSYDAKASDTAVDTIGVTTGEMTVENTVVTTGDRTGGATVERTYGMAEAWLAD